MTEKPRESLGSRLGFILISAGCAVGLGNVWRFPFIVGKYGGCIFVLLYLLFLVILGFPLMTMEMSVGRGSRRGILEGFSRLAPSHHKFWNAIGIIFFIGAPLLMMYYTSVSGWLLSYTADYATGALSSSADAAFTQQHFGALIGNPARCIFFMVIASLLGGITCCFSLKRGVENISKFLMLGILVLMGALVIFALRLPNASAGLKFYLEPNWANFTQNPFETISAAMCQAFFSLSLGNGAMQIFGSYFDQKKSMVSECFWIIVIDTLVALVAGLIIFPICASNGINVDCGPSLIFVSLPTACAQLPGSRIWGFFFFAFMSLAAITTIIAVFESIIAALMDTLHFSRKSAAVIVTLGIILLSLPCVFGFNIWSGFQPLGAGTTILDLEDFLVSQNFLPLGTLFYLFFCTMPSAWGSKNFQQEVFQGSPTPFAAQLLTCCKYYAPFLMILLFLLGYLPLIQKFFAK